MIMPTSNKLISMLQQRITKLKVYALEMDCGIMSYLHICAAYSLEEAIKEARLRIMKDPQKNQIDISTWNLHKYVFRELEEIITESTKLEILPGEEILNKNKLMQKIITDNDIELFHSNLSIFNEYEKKLLNDKLANEIPKKSSKKKI